MEQTQLSEIAAMQGWLEQWQACLAGGSPADLANRDTPSTSSGAATTHSPQGAPGSRPARSGALSRELSGGVRRHVEDGIFIKSSAIP